MRERLRINGEVVPVRVGTGTDGELRVHLDGAEHAVSGAELKSGVLSFTYGGQRYSYSVLLRLDSLLLSDGRAYYSIQRVEEGAAASDGAGSAGSLASQMPGTILKLLVEPGTSVAKGTALLILEAMKMEHEVCAPADGTVMGYPKPAGARVMPGDLLIEFTAG
jgi:3-methylcrotonyl-CoA carboxylase alpha subunit